MSKKKRQSFDVAKLPLERRQALAAANPGCERQLGLLPPQKEEKPKTSGARRGGTKTRRGPLLFDSKTEAHVYDQLRERYPTVIAHGAIALSDDEAPDGYHGHLEPDFVIVLETYPDGTFRGKMADAKAIWKGAKKGHMEKDWKAKRAWCREKTGLHITVITPQGEEE